MYKNKIQKMYRQCGNRVKYHLGRPVLSCVAGTLLASVLLAGCAGTQSNAAQSNAAQSNAAQSNAAQSSATQSSATQSNAAQSQTTAADFSYADLAGYEFDFSSGVGGWGTFIHVEADGSFSGAYHDMDMGDADPDKYPEGSMEWSAFSGKFTEPVKIDEQTYSLKIKEISYENEPGTEEIKDGCRYSYETAYGLDDAEELRLYLPGTPLNELSDEVRSWLDGSSNLQGDTLESYALVSLPKEEAFSSTYYGNQK